MKYLVFLFLLAATSCTKEGPGPQSGLVPFKAKQKRLADQLISCFENDTPVIQYDYAEILGDGRGITAGRAGFTTGTGDLLLVVELYTDTLPNNPLAVYLPLLRQYAAAASDATAGLEQLPLHWKQCAADPLFCTIQDEVSDSLYYTPAVSYAKANGITYPLTLLCIYDACIQHGDGDDPDGLSAMIDKTNRRCGGSPAEGVDEYRWLKEFNQVREHTLKHPDNKDTRDEWRESVGRVHALDELRKKGDFLLDNNTTCVTPYGQTRCITM
jgi:chitosanase